MSILQEPTTPGPAAAAAAMVRGTDRPVPLTPHRVVTMCLTWTDPLSTDTAAAVRVGAW